ncbi:uncharacterized protein LOC134266645 [Saccostrea cucullata]|uniref:uncharacterized protein LOC134266645 n=1 Tax=Saccostrea cuccullata TaxID=36930 RepID=UPI002ED598E4
MKMQDPPTIRTTSILDDGCKTDQTVSAFLYLKDEQLDTEINCQTIYWGSFRRTIRKSINIKTIPERNQILGPVVVITDELEDRSLQSLTCKTTTDILNSTENIQWCIRKEKNMQYVPLPLQEDQKIEIFNRSTEKTIKSSVLYQLLKSDENVEIICETNYSKTCGSGTLKGTVLLNSEPIKARNVLQNYTNVTLEQSDQLDNGCPTDEPNIMLYASASVMTAGIIILLSGVFTFCRAKKRVKNEASTSSLNAAADKSNMPKANGYKSVGNNPVSHAHKNQISSGGQISSNAPDGSDDGDMYEPIELHDYEPHVYEGKL